MTERVVAGAAGATVVVLLAFFSGGYFPSEWGLEALVFLLAAAAMLIISDSATVNWRRVALPLLLLVFGLWQLLSATWSTGAGIPVLEAERSLVYASATAALTLCLTPARVDGLLTGVVGGVTIVSLWALGTRLAPGTLGGAYDPSSGYQLAQPIGYSNALALLLVLGITLAAGITLHNRRSSPAAAAALVPLGAAFYFTFSRGGFLALASALTILVSLEARRLRAAAVVAGTLALPVVGVLLASHSPALTAPGATLQTAQMQGHRLAWELLFLSLVQAGAVVGARLLKRRIPPSRALTRGIGLAALTSGIALLSLGAIRAGGPSSLIGHLRSSFTTQAPPIEQGPARRVLSFGDDGRGDYWTVAARMVTQEPLLGAGAGAFAARWVQDRPVNSEASEAHNLYLETLAELGPVGLTLLLVVLILPLAVLRRRRKALTPAAAGAYVAFLIHAAVDWDWEIPLLVLVGLACGACLLALESTAHAVPLTGLRRSLGLALLSCLLFAALVAHIGNRAVAAAQDALQHRNPRRAAANATRARTWMPWSYEPWQLLGEAQLAEGADRAARISLHRAASLDPGQWSIWYDLALAERGREGTQASTRAAHLNPLALASSTTGLR